MLILLSLASLATADPGPARGVDAGTHGPWHGWCAVDGALAGFEHPECRLTARFGRTGVELVRTAAGVVVSLDDRRCPARAAVTVPAARMADPASGGRYLHAGIARAFAHCGLPVPVLDRRDLRALLRGTDGAF